MTAVAAPEFNAKQAAARNKIRLDEFNMAVFRVLTSGLYLKTAPLIGSIIRLPYTEWKHKAVAAEGCWELERSC